MGRMREDEEVATQRVAFRASPALVAAIDAARGDQSKGAWLRSLVRAAVQVPVERPAEAPAAEEASVRPHRHRREVETSRTYVKGTLVQTWACSCGKVMS